MKSSKGEERRLAIEAAARQMLLNQGYSGVSLRKIANQLGISVGNLQYYFSTKDDLVEAVILGETQKPIELLGNVLWNPNDLEANVDQAVGSLMRYYASDAGRFYAIMEVLALHDHRYAKIKADGYAYILSHIEQLVAIMSPNLSLDRRAGLAQVLVALIDGASLQVQFSRGSAHGDGIAALIDDVSKAIQHLLRVWE
ncbi:TetR/AcrR family transcriptional regulator [Tateyamaria omphalii]|uniref:TetR/AcrR family transcriptional regulator n=1 Tax=Tateyamaria omphalii TaxID=299262 RepID=UPI001676D8C1|nr:TetR/AcrR family transcriptional regulator [Tateyamaria omphalii]